MIGSAAVGQTLKEVDVTAAKTAAASKPKKTAAGGVATSAGRKGASSAKKAAPAGKNAVTVPRKSAPKTTTGAAKGSASVAKKSVTKKRAPAAKKAAAGSKKTTSVTKKTTVASKKAATASKTAAPAAKKAAPAVKKAAPVPAPPKRPTVGPYAKEAKFLEEQRVLLMEERSIYKGQAVDLRAEADSLALEREPGDVQFDEESGEGGTVTVDRERNLALSAQASAAVEEIDDALRKIDRKTYGGCERCYQPIPKARLRALPFARLCVACKSGGLSRR
jgi:DnaK suppressor protein